MKISESNLATLNRASSIQETIFELKLARLQECKGSAGACAMLDFSIGILEARLTKILESFNLLPEKENVETSS